MKQIHEALQAILLDPNLDKLSLETQEKLANAIERFEFIVPVFTSAVLKARNDIVESQEFTWIGGLADGRMLVREVSKYEKIRRSGCTNDSRRPSGLRPV